MFLTEVRKNALHIIFGLDDWVVICEILVHVTTKTEIVMAAILVPLHVIVIIRRKVSDFNWHYKYYQVHRIADYVKKIHRNI